MSMIRCVRRAAAAGGADAQTRKRLEYAYSIAHADAIDSRAAAGEAERLANEAFDNTLKTIAHERTVAANRQAEAERRLLADAARFRNDKGQADIGEYGMRLINDVHFRAQALFALDNTDLAAMAHAFGRDAISGKRKNHQRADLMIDEMFGVDTGDGAARTLAQSAEVVLRRKVEQFNGAGGNIAPLERYVPQHHDGVTIGLAGEHKWREAIIANVDHTRMANADTGRPFTAREFDETLGEIFESIKWHALGEPDAGLVGERSMALWKRRNDPRFFVFKDADAWRRYHNEFGGKMHPYEMLMQYLRGIDRDIAAMQLMGPNPSRTVVLWAGQNEKAPGGLIMQAARDADAGRAALFPTHGNRITTRSATTEMMVAPFRNFQERMQYAKDKAIGMHRAWDSYTGAARRPFNDGWAYATSTGETLMYGSMLPYTPFLVGGDIVNQAATRAFISPGMQSMLRDLVEAFQISGDRKTQAELAIEFDTGLSVFLSEARDSLPVHGSPKVRYVTDRVMTYTLLKPMTMGLRATWTLGILHDIARHIRTPFNRLPMRDFLLRYGIDEGAWEFIQATPVRHHRGRPVIRPGDIAGVDIFELAARDGEISETMQARPGLSRGEEVAIRLLQAIKQEGEYATVSGTPRSARILPYKPGSISGFLIGSAARLKTYAISHWQHHARRAAAVFHNNGGGIRGMSGAARYYGGSVVIPSMFLVGIGTYLSEIAKGNNPPDVTDWKFWDRVFWRTVSLGFFQDIFQGLFDSDNPLQAWGRIQGPTASLASDVIVTGATGIKEAGAALGLYEDDTRFGRQAIRTVKQVVPRTWATDVAVDRLIWDNVQRMVDPDAEEDFANRAQRASQGMWAAPGQPARWPDLSTTDLGNSDDDSLIVR